MANKTYQGNVRFPSNFEVETTRPLDTRLVLNSSEDLTNGTIEYPYTGMVVSIVGSPELWILIGPPDKASLVSSWKKVSGSGGLSKYSIPLMTPSMREEAIEDSDCEFSDSDDYIMVDTGESLTGRTETNFLTAENGTYLEIMFSALRQMQAEINKIKNTFKYGINSYTDTNTSLSSISGTDYVDDNDDEPLWAIDPDELSELTEIKRINEDQLARFSKNDKSNNVVWTVSGKTERITVTSEGSNFELTSDEKIYIKNIDDAKFVIFLTIESTTYQRGNETLYNKPTASIRLKNLDDLSKPDIIFNPFDYLDNIKMVPVYNLMVIISRKVTSSTDKTKTSGKNTIYMSLSDATTDEIIARGYYDPDVEGSLTRYSVALGYRYYWDMISFSSAIISNGRFCSKYLNFSNDVVPETPDNKNDFKYEAAHITIRSIKDIETAKKIMNQLQENELIWIKDTASLRIKSDGTLKAVSSGSNDNEIIRNEDNMTPKELLSKLQKMGIIVNTKAEVGDAADADFEVNDIMFNDVASITFINQDTNKKFKFTVDAYGELQSTEDVVNTLSKMIEDVNTKMGATESTKAYMINLEKEDYKANRGLIANIRKGAKDINDASDFGNNGDRLRISSFFVPLKSATKCGCSHSFIELENSSTIDIPLKGMYLYHKYFDATNKTWKMRNIELTGVCKAGSTYLIRGAKHADLDLPSTFIKVDTYDQEWYENGELVSFEFDNDVTAVTNPKLKEGICSFILTYGEISGLTLTTKLVVGTSEDKYAGSNKDKDVYPYVITNPRYIDGISYNSASSASSDNSYATKDAPPCSALDWAAFKVALKDNTMYRIMFKLDPAKQAFNGFNTKDGSRAKGKATDVMILDLSSPTISFKTSGDVYPISKYAPKASYCNASVMTDKTKLDFEKPNMVNVSFGIDVYKTRTFNWVSVGTFDEYVWIRKQGTTTWSRFESYKSGDGNVESDGSLTKKIYSEPLKSSAYDRIVARFPGDFTTFTSHKCVLELSQYVSTKTVYEYRVGRGTGFGNNTIDDEHCSPIRTFTVYPQTWEGRVYQITDQQGFHWVEYQVWAGVAKALNQRIIDDNLESTNEFPIIINTGDMTQSGARINEWLDYHIAGEPLFNHLEQMNCVGNNDLNDINPEILGTGNDSGKSNARFFHYFYCHDVEDKELVMGPDSRYVPSTYYFKTNKMMYICFNSEITTTTSKNWFKLNYYTDKTSVIDPYTGIICMTSTTDGTGDMQNCMINREKMIELHFVPIYKTLYKWLYNNKVSTTPKSVVFACHEIPFTVITVDSLKGTASEAAGTRNYPAGGAKPSLLGCHANQIDNSETSGTYWLSRLFEYFGVKIAIGGHKHTYAISWPLQEYYFYNKYTNIGLYEYSNGAWNKVSTTTKKIVDVYTSDATAAANPTTTQLSDITNTFSDSAILEGSTLQYQQYTIRLFTYSSSETKSSMPYVSGKSDGQGHMYMTYNQIELESKGLTTAGVPTGDKKVNLTWTITAPKSYSGSGVRYLHKDYSIADNVIINTTKLPLMNRNKNIFGVNDTYGADASGETAKGFNSQYLYRCATPFGWTYSGSNIYPTEELPSPVVYFMLQASGYKITSNKELPSAYQYFSRIIPQTTNNISYDASTQKYTTTSTANNNQCYPMYAMLKVGTDNSKTCLDLYMARVKGIVVSSGAKITFQQGTKPPQASITYDFLTPSDTSIYGSWINGKSGTIDYSTSGGVVLQRVIY